MMIEKWFRILLLLLHDRFHLFSLWLQGMKSMHFKFFWSQSLVLPYYYHYRSHLLKMPFHWQKHCASACFRLCLSASLSRQTLFLILPSFQSGAGPDVHLRYPLHTAVSCFLWSWPDFLHDLLDGEDDVDVVVLIHPSVFQRQGYSIQQDTVKQLGLHGYSTELLIGD